IAVYHLLVFSDNFFLGYRRLFHIGIALRTDHRPAVVRPEHLSDVHHHIKPIDRRPPLCGHKILALTILKNRAMGYTLPTRMPLEGIRTYHWLVCMIRCRRS